MRLFVAVWPSPELTEQVRRIDRPARRGVRWTTPDQWHVTLRFFGAVDDVDLAKSALGGLGRVGAVTALAGPGAQRLGPSMLCVPVAGLEGLASAVTDATGGVGQPPADRPFRGHLTLARAAKGIDPRPPTPIAVSARWPVTEITLVASTLRPSGASYEVIDRYLLAPGP